MNIYWVNSFTSEAFSGNPAAVCVSQQALSASQMQAIAKELNLSETAFAHQLPNGHWQIRWFTPTTEVPLCGHATLATAHILWMEKFAHTEFPIIFESQKHGALTVTINEKGITLAFPKQALKSIAEKKSEIELLLNLTTEDILITPHNEKTIAVLANEDLVKNYQPDFEKISSLQTLGLVITSHANNKPYQIASRYFGPKIGIPEDPVTGVAHCCVGPYWLDQLNLKTLTAYQASTRSGLIDIEMQDENTVLLTGKAITLFGGKANSSLRVYESN